ncbi:MAG TPA: ATP-binding protein [Chloroflexi bacterium]|nr:ATP-binding protein [Chloroflexota bacterium]
MARLVIEEGRKETGAQLGPLQAGQEVVFSDFTLLIGPQATGKSLVMQLHYFAHGLQYLIAAAASAEDVFAGSNELVRSLLDRLRRGLVRDRSRAFASLVDKTIRLNYHPTGVYKPWRLSIGGDTLKVRILGGEKSTLEKLITAWTKDADWRARGQRQIPAIYVPAERSFYSRYVNAGAGALSAPELPLTMLMFTRVLETARDTYLAWDAEGPDTEAGRMIWQIAGDALQGEAYIPTRGPKLWKWRTPEEKILDLEMASSGQMEAWPLVLIAACLPSWREEGLLDQDFYLCVEEPETHLHPAAQVALVKILAYLVNQGFKVVVTTHSLTVLYTLNNLLVASDLQVGYTEAALPQPETRLKRGTISAYLFEAGEIHSLIDSETQLICEEALAEVDESLDRQLNRLEFLRAYPSTEVSDDTV